MKLTEAQRVAITTGENLAIAYCTLQELDEEGIEIVLSILKNYRTGGSEEFRNLSFSGMIKSVEQLRFENEQHEIPNMV